MKKILVLKCTPKVGQIKFNIRRCTSRKQVFLFHPAFLGWMSLSTTMNSSSMRAFDSVSTIFTM